MKKLWLVYGRKFNPIEWWEPKYDVVRERIFNEHHFTTEEQEELQNKEIAFHTDSWGDSTFTIAHKKFEDAEIEAKASDFSFNGIISNVVGVDVEVFATKEEAVAFVVRKNPDGKVDEDGTMYACKENGMWEYIVKEKELKGE